jgi:hypothetical protein
MEPFNLSALAADHRAAREREARTERLWRRRRHIESAAPTASTAKPPCRGHLRHAAGGRSW